MYDYPAQAIEAVSEPQDHNPLDVFVLFILYSLPARKKSIETMFTTKIKSGSFSEDIMDNVFGVHAGVSSYLTDCSLSPF